MDGLIDQLAHAFFSGFRQCVQLRQRCWRYAGRDGYAALVGGLGVAGVGWLHCPAMN